MNYANRYLAEILMNKSIPVVVRHEAGEAIAAINDPTFLDLLEQYCNDEFTEVAETCQIARDRIKYFINNPNAIFDDPYGTIDPAPPLESNDLNYLESLFLDESAELFLRYRAMFSLRNIASPDCVRILCKGFHCKSALFKHEIAFVLGELRNETFGVSELIDVINNEDEHPMVRHECAEALGNIATDQAINFLNTRLNDKSRIVRESCFVALDIADYQKSDRFEYA